MAALFKPFADDRWAGVDTNDPRATRPLVDELVRHPRRNDRHVSWAGLQLLIRYLEADVAFLDHPGLVVGVTVQPRSLAGLALVDDQRNRSAVVFASNRGSVEFVGVDQ